MPPADLEDWELPKRMQPKPDSVGYDLDRALASVMALSAEAPEDAFTASSLGTERTGNAVLIDDSGVVLTIGYLVMEAERVLLRTNQGRVAHAHVLGVDAASGFGLLQALEPLDIPAIEVGSSQNVSVGERVVVAAGGGPGRALESRLQARQEFAGYWEYLLDEALFTAPAHPLWSGSAVISPRGELIGIGSLQLEQRGDDGRVAPFNMSVPAELLAPIYDDLLRGRPTGEPRPWLGLLAQQIGDSVVAVGVSDGGPCGRAEVRPGDVILALDGGPVDSLAGFYRSLWSSGPPGVRVTLTLRREQDAFDVEVRTADRKALLRKPRYH